MNHSKSNAQSMHFDLIQKYELQKMENCLEIKKLTEALAKAQQKEQKNVAYFSNQMSILKNKLKCYMKEVDELKQENDFLSKRLAETNKLSKSKTNESSEANKQNLRHENNASHLRTSIKKESTPQKQEEISELLNKIFEELGNIIDLIKFRITSSWQIQEYQEWNQELHTHSLNWQGRVGNNSYLILSKMHQKLAEIQLALRNGGPTVHANEKKLKIFEHIGRLKDDLKQLPFVEKIEKQKQERRCLQIIREAKQKQELIVEYLEVSRLAEE